MKRINVKHGLIEGKERLKLYFGYDKEVIDLIKTIPWARWHPVERCWHVSVLAGGVEKLNKRFDGKLLFESDGKTVGREDGKTAGREDLVPDEFTKTMVLKNYSPNTIRTYKAMMQEFLVYYKDLDPGKISEEQIRDYLVYLLEKRKVSISYQNQSINAIKFYYEQVLGRPVRTYYIQRPKRGRPLPNVLSEAEVLMILNCVDNLKHKCILSLIYSAGLRIGELVELKVHDIDSKRNYVIIRNGKGLKDRYSLLSARVLVLLRQYYSEYRPKTWLFEGLFGAQYSCTSIRSILKAAVTKAGIKRRVNVHMLRHSFATHLLEQGVDMRYIQTLLGHQSSRTTEIYTHITKKGLGKIKSPLDNLDL